MMIKELCNELLGKSSCNDCNNCSIGETIKKHNEQVRAEFIDEIIKYLLDDYSSYVEFETDLLIKDLQRLKGAEE